MLNKFSVILIIVSSFALFGCNSNNHQNSQQKVETANSPVAGQTTQNETLMQSGAVNFKDVSFNYDPQIFVEVRQEEAEEVPLENETDKPDYIHPQQIVFTLKNKNQREAKITVFALEDYRRIWSAVDKKDVASSRRDLEDFKKIVRNIKPSRDNDVPYLLFYDAHQTLTTKIKPFPFQSGKGFFFLTQFDQDFANLVNNDELIYVYQGISNDGTQYVLAEFPVTVSFLPDSSALEFEGYKLPPDYEVYEAHKKSYQ